MVSPTNQMLVTFSTDSNSGLHYPGFEASYSSCFVLISASGVVSSPNYPDSYNNLESVCWVISPPEGYVVSLSFDTFETEYFIDYVSVFDGKSTNSPLLSSASGNATPSAVNSSSNAMLIVFSSTYQNPRPGFQATFNTVFAATTTTTTTITTSAVDTSTKTVPMTTTRVPSSAILSATGSMKYCLCLLMILLVNQKFQLNI